MASAAAHDQDRGIPPALVWDHSLAAFTRELDDPWLAGARLHAGPDIVWATDAAYGRPGWIVTRHALVQEVLMDHARFSAGSGEMGKLLGVEWGLIPIEVDPPAHLKYRQILNPFFAPSAVAGLDETVRAICEELVAGIAEHGRCDFIADFAALFPSYVFLALMGMPRAMLPQFLAWEADFMRPAEPDARVAAARAIHDYLRDFLAERAGAPRTALVDAILSAEVDGRPLDEGEVLGIAYLLYLGGLDTVYSSLGWYMRHLARDLPLQRRLRARPEDVPLAVEEFTRAFAVSKTVRTVARDVDFHGAPLRAGDLIHAPTYLAARDERVYADPHRIDIDRRARPIAFGTGPHVCLGIHLAKREIRIVLETFLARLPEIRLVPGEPAPFHTGSVLGLERLMIAWDRAEGVA